MKAKKLLLVAFAGIALLSAVALLVTYSPFYFGLKPSLKINSCTHPVRLSGELPEHSPIGSRKDFVEFLQSKQVDVHTNSISTDLSLDSFIRDNEIIWSDVLRSTKTALGLFGKAYILEYQPKPATCQWAAFSINSAGTFYSIDGCCGDIQELKPGESRGGYSSFPNE